MTTYQGQLRSKSTLEARILAVVAVVALVLVMIAALANRAMLQEIRESRASLTTCQEFLSDLEASEAF